MLMAGAAYRLGNFDRLDRQIATTGARPVLSKDVAQLFSIGGGRLSKAMVWTLDFFAYLDDLGFGLTRRGYRLSAASTCRYGSRLSHWQRNSGRHAAPSSHRIRYPQSNLPAGEGLSRSRFPAAVSPRLTHLQFLWALFAIRHGGFIAYLRGSSRLALSNRARHASQARRTDRQAPHQR